MLFRQILIRLLLLSLLFTAAIASPLHSAMHLQHATLIAGKPAPDLPVNEENRPTGQEHGQEQDADSLCAWCLSPALQTSGWPAPPTHLSMAVLSGQAMPQVPAPATVFRPSPGRWPFSSRDPPLA